MTENKTVYVCYSMTDDIPFIVQNRSFIHKIGVTADSVENRIAGAENKEEFLKAPVRIVATFPYFEVEGDGLEKILHTIFDPVRYSPPELTYNVKEWFIIPLGTIESAVEKIKNRDIGINHRYNYENISFNKVT